MEERDLGDNDTDLKARFASAERELSATRQQFAVSLQERKRSISASIDALLSVRLLTRSQKS